MKLSERLNNCIKMGKKTINNWINLIIKTNNAPSKF